MIEVKNEQEMRTLGEHLGQLLKGGETIELIGDVGAGKTTLTRGIARGMHVGETVQSPSFTISRVYEAPGGRQLVHYDFYRLSDAGIMRDELQETAGSPDTSVVIEWADAVEDILPADRLTVTIAATGEESRRLTLHSGGETSERLRKELA